jgi:hypothetical protein
MIAHYTAEQPPKGNVSMSETRKGKIQLGGYFDPRDVFTFKELLMRESRERGHLKSTQEGLEDAIAEYCARRNVTLPSLADSARQKASSPSPAP